MFHTTYTIAWVSVTVLMDSLLMGCPFLCRKKRNNFRCLERRVIYNAQYSNKSIPLNELSFARQP